MIKVPRKHIYRFIPNILTIISSDWSITIGDNALNFGRRTSRNELRQKQGFTSNYHNISIL